MAQPSTELKNFRERLTSLLDKLDDRGEVMAIIDGAGSTDAERKAFFEQWINAPEQSAYDLSSQELLDIVTKLRALDTWLETELPTLAKGRI